MEQTDLTKPKFTHIAYSARTNQRLKSADSRPINVQECRFATNHRLKNLVIGRDVACSSASETARGAFHTGEKMSRRKRVQLNEDITLERALTHLSAEEGERLSPDATEVYQEMLENLEFPRNDEVAEETQFVFQGQLLVLGDSRAGKTSLVKALTGEKFNCNEEKTHGVEAKLVDRKWKAQDLADLVFGRFHQFCERKEEESAFLPRIFNKLKYRYGNTHCAEDSDRIPLTLERLLIEKSGISTIVGDSPLACIIFFFVYLYVSAALLGSWRSCILLIAAELLLNIFQAFKGVGVKHNLFKYAGIYLGGLVAKCCVAYVFSIPFYGTVYGLANLQVGVIKEIAIVTLDLDLNLFAISIALIILAVFQCIIGMFSFSRKIPLLLLLDNVLDIKDSLETMMLLAFFTCIRICLFSVAYIEIFATEIVLAFIVMHLMYLYHQNLLNTNRVAIIAALAVELAIVTSVFLGNSIFLSSISVLIIAFSLHGYGKWLQIRGFFQGKSFVDVFFHINFPISALIVEKTVTNKRKLKVALDQAFSSLRFRVLDFAGDKEYYAYHHMFLRKEALYLVVFSIRDFVEDNFQNIDKKVRRLWFWLESVCSHVSPHTPIFLVGTHRGRVKDTTLQTLDRHLHRNLWSFFCDELITCKYKGQQFMYFPVENSGGLNDLGICNLRKTIMNVAHDKECKAIMSADVPHSWIKVQDFVIDMRDKCSQFCWALKDFKEEMEAICTITSPQSMLEYFHARGLVIYVEKDPVLSQWVLLKPGLLVEIIILLVNTKSSAQQQRGFRQQWDVLHNTGMLTEALLHNILSRVAGEESEEPMRRFLEEYDLICPLSHQELVQRCSLGKETHFVPSLLPTSSGVGNQMWCNGPQDAKCYVFFKTFLPEPLFHRLISRCYKHSQLVYPEGEPRLCRDCGLFWLGSQQPYRLQLMKDEGLIEVTFVRLVHTLYLCTLSNSSITQNRGI